MSTPDGFTFDPISVATDYARYAGGGHGAATDSVPTKNVALTARTAVRSRKFWVCIAAEPVVVFTVIKPFIKAAGDQAIIMTVPVHMPDGEALRGGAIRFELHVVCIPKASLPDGRFRQLMEQAGGFTLSPEEWARVVDSEHGLHVFQHDFPADVVTNAAAALIEAESTVVDVATLGEARTVPGDYFGTDQGGSDPGIGIDPECLMSCIEDGAREHTEIPSPMGASMVAAAEATGAWVMVTSDESVLVPVLAEVSKRAGQNALLSFDMVDGHGEAGLHVVIILADRLSEEMAAEALTGFGPQYGPEATRSKDLSRSPRVLAVHGDQDRARTWALYNFLVGPFAECGKKDGDPFSIGGDPSVPDC
jgi:hypothetical protein